MRFREEVFAKIFTYITVTILLGIIIFEAWSLRQERAALGRSEEAVLSTQQKLDAMTDRNQKLQEENRELQIFQNTWIPYAAFVDSSEVLTLKTDLFTRPDLIPEAVLEDVKAELIKRLKELEAAQEEGEEGEEPSGKDGDDSRKERDEEEDEPEEILLDFQFDNPDGEDIFLPLSMDSAQLHSCLIYTVAFETENDLSVELLFEVEFENGHNAVRDENGEVAWKCVAYNPGDGWKGIVVEEGENEDAVD